MAMLQRWATGFYSKIWIIYIQHENNRKNPAAGNAVEDVEIAVTLKYLSSFGRFLKCL